MFRLFFPLLITFTLTSCTGDVETFYPKNERERKYEKAGRLTGEEGLVVSGKSDRKGGGENPLGVNSFLWRATLDTVSFMPLASADPFGGVIITDWYEDPSKQGERFKINAMVMSKELRADGIKANIFKQKFISGKGWSDVKVSPETSKQLEDTILTRAREMKTSSR